MRILIGIHHFPPRYTGGAEWEAYRLADGLQERGHSVKVVCVERIDADQDAPLTWKEDIYDGISVQRIYLDLRQAKDPDRWEYDNPWIGEHFSQILASEPWDLIHLIGGYLLTASALRSGQAAAVPVVVTLTDFWYACRQINLVRSSGQVCPLPFTPDCCARCVAEEKRRFRWPARLFPSAMDSYWSHRSHGVYPDRLQVLLDALGGADQIISGSRFLRSFYIQLGLPPERVRTIRQSAQGQPASLVAHQTGSSQLRIGYIGQIAPHKGVDLLIKACQQLPSDRLSVQIYGDPGHYPQYAHHWQQVSRPDSRIRWMGVFQGSEALHEVYQNLDVLVVPSRCYENSPTVILEAFNHQVPVIAANLGGMAELVSPEVDGLLFDVEDDRALARQIQRLLDEPALLQKLRDGIRPGKTREAWLDDLEAVYQQAVCEKQGAPEHA